VTCCTTHVVFHSGLHEEQYAGVEDRFVFCKVGSQTINIKNKKLMENVIFCESLSGFVPMGSHWAESEFLFSLYRTMLKEPNRAKTPWIAFCQYDNTIQSDEGESLVSFMDTKLIDMEDCVVSFAPFSVWYEINENRITMDFSDPQKLQGNPLCYFPMIAQYNKFYGTKWSYSDLIQAGELALCSSFIMRTERFMEMMRFCSWMISVVDLNLFDPLRRHRMAGGLMERYYATWIALQQLQLKRFRLNGLSRI
jgi:hypothetical protein